MREEVQRIIKLVQEGKLSAEDAAELIDAFASANGEAAPVEEKQTAQAPPQEAKDPFKTFVESMEKLGKEASDSVNWPELAGQIREGASKGVDALRQGLEEVSKGKFNLSWLKTQETKEVVLPISLPPGKTLRIDNPCGNVSVVSGFDVGTVTAHARFRGATVEEAKAKASAYTLIIEESDHLALIRQPDVSGLNVDLEVQLSSDCTVEVHCGAGNVDLLDTKGGCRIQARSGDIRLRGLDGAIEVASMSGNLSVEDSLASTLSVENKSGDILLRGVRGDLQVKTTNGNARIVDCVAKILTVASVLGNVTVELSEPISGKVDVRTVSGNAEVSLMDGSDCRVHLSTHRGIVSCDLVLADEARSEQRITGRLGSGLGSVDVSTVSGNVGAKLRDAVAS